MALLLLIAAGRNTKFRNEFLSLLEQHATDFTKFLCMLSVAGDLPLWLNGLMRSLSRSAVVLAG